MRHPTPPPNNPISDPFPPSHIQITGRAASTPAPRCLPSIATLHPRRMRLNIGVSYHVREMKAKEHELELKRLEVALLQAQNDSRRITLEEDRNWKENLKFDNFMREQTERNRREEMKFDNFMREQGERG